MFICAPVVVVIVVVIVIVIVTIFISVDVLSDNDTFSLTPEYGCPRGV